MCHKQGWAPAYWHDRLEDPICPRTLRNFTKSSSTGRESNSSPSAWYCWIPTRATLRLYELWMFFVSHILLQIRNIHFSATPNISVIFIVFCTFHVPPIFTEAENSFGFRSSKTIWNTHQHYLLPSNPKPNKGNRMCNFDENKHHLR